MGNATPGLEAAMPLSQKSSDPKPLRRRFRIRPVVFLALVLLLVGLPLVWFWRQAHARYTVISKTDPVTGYRAVFTVSQRWKTTAPKTQTGKVDSIRFNPPAPNAVQSWINTHVFHYPPLSKTHQDRFNAVTYDAIPVGSGGLNTLYLVEDRQGYVSHKPLPPQFHILKQEHLLISGQPATWWVISLQITSSQQDYACGLEVKPLHQPILYELEGITDNQAQFNDILQEVTAIRDSLRIERSPAQGRR